MLLDQQFFSSAGRRLSVALAQNTAQNEALSLPLSRGLSFISTLLAGASELMVTGAGKSMMVTGEVIHRVRFRRPWPNAELTPMTVSRARTWAARRPVQGFRNRPGLHGFLNFFGLFGHGRPMGLSRI